MYYIYKYVLYYIYMYIYIYIIYICIIYIYICIEHFIATEAMAHFSTIYNAVPIEHGDFPVRYAKQSRSTSSPEDPYPLSSLN